MMMLRLAVLIAFASGAVGAGIFPSCSDGYTLTTGSPGPGCGLWTCLCDSTDAAACSAGQSYCPCPMLYTDVSLNGDASSCQCALGTVCGNRCPDGYIFDGVQCNKPSAQSAGEAFSITLVNFGTDPLYQQYFEAAAAKWQSVITGDLTDVGEMDVSLGGWFNGQFGSAGDYYEAVDDIVIGYSVGQIDGAGDGTSNVLAQSAPLYTRSNTDDPSYRLPISGIMQFDLADIQSIIDEGNFDTVILHEMGHVLGIGSLWPTVAANCASTCNVYAAGSTGVCTASEEYTALGLPGDLLLESKGQPGDGTYCSHWSEQELYNELMTGTLDPSIPYNPLSTITVGALEDLGYTVDYSMADPLEEPVRMRKLRLAKEAAAGTADVKKQIRYLHNDVIPGITRPYVPVN